MTTKLVKRASNEGQITKSKLSDGRRAKFFPSRRNLTTIGFDLKITWEMSDEMRLLIALHGCAVRPR